MGYIEESLGEHEQLLYEAHFHWIYFVLACLALLVLGIIIVGIVIFLYMMIRALTTEIGVTDQRVILKYGWIRRQTEEFSLSTIEEVNLNQGVIGRILGFGSVTIEGTGGGHIGTPGIMANPVKFRRAIANARENLRS